MRSADAVVFNIAFTPPTPGENWTAKQKATWASNHKFYSCNAAPDEIDVAHYTADDEKADRPNDELLREQAAARLGMDLSERLPDKSEARRIDEYMTRFNTLGAFNLGGAMTQRELDDWIEGARKTPGIIWHGVLSLPAWQSKYVGYEDMERLVRQTFGSFLRNAGFDPNNIALLAAMHENTENKHIHFTFYEKAPKYRDKYGELHYRKKGKISEQAITEYRMSATAYLDENKRSLTKYRDAVINALRGVPTDNDLYTALNTLADRLPKRGRLQYNSDNIAPYRKDIDNVVQMLLRSSPSAMQAHKNVLSEIARRGSAIAETGAKSEYVKRITNEYKSRLGNVVLGMVKQYRSNPKARLGTRGEPKTCKQHKAAARRRRSYGARIIQSAIRILNGERKSLQDNFTRELQRAEREIEFNLEKSQKSNRS